MSERRRVHFVYPRDSAGASRERLVRHLGERLAARYTVIHHEWDHVGVIAPQPGDVLLGRPHPRPGTCYRASAKSSAWARKIMLCPFTSDLGQSAYLDAVVPAVDSYLAITGSYWMASVEQTTFAHWRPKMVHVDMAVDAMEYPFIKESFNPAGKRRFVYVGEPGPQRNTEYLSRLAELVPEVSFSWIGAGGGQVDGLETVGPLSFSDPEARVRVAQFDFSISVDRASACSVEMLEAMSWGLLPVCSAQSGLYHNTGVANLSLADEQSAARVIRALNEVDEPWLMEMQRHNLGQIETHFNWDRFADQVIEEIESRESRPLGHEPLRRRLALRYAAMRSWQRGTKSFGRVR